MFSLTTYTGGIAVTNGYLLSLAGSTLLIDAPEGVTDWLKRKGKKVDALLLTHQHFDHVMDAAKVKEQHGCPIYAWDAYSQQLTLETLYGAVTGSPYSVPPFEVDQVLKGKSSIQVGGVDWQLFHIPGHSLDSVCFYDSEAKIVFGGDVLFKGSVGRTDLPGGSFEQLASGIIKHLWPLPEETKVVPGHGPATTVGDERRNNPFVGE